MEQLLPGRAHPMEWTSRLNTIGIAPKKTTSRVLFWCRHVPHSGFPETLPNAQRAFARQHYPTPSVTAKHYNHRRNGLSDLALTDALPVRVIPQPSHSLPAIFSTHQPPIPHQLLSPPNAGIRNR